MCIRKASRRMSEGCRMMQVGCMRMQRDQTSLEASMKTEIYSLSSNKRRAWEQGVPDASDNHTAGCIWPGSMKDMVWVLLCWMDRGCVR